MKRSEFIKVMDKAIKRMKRGNHFSCSILCHAYTKNWHEYNRLIVRDYGKMFNYQNNPRSSWLGLMDDPDLHAERIGMLELFKEVALDSKLYWRY